MKTENENEKRPPQKAPEAQRRPYAKPVVESFPLFERMALNCDIEFKDSPRENSS